jgi:hypothetical protein
MSGASEELVAAARDGWLANPNLPVPRRDPLVLHSIELQVFKKRTILWPEGAQPVGCTSRGHTSNLSFSTVANQNWDHIYTTWFAIGFCVPRSRFGPLITRYLG